MTTPQPLYLTRESTRLYTASNGEATIAVGDRSLHEGVFTPGELLQLALAGCAAMSADHTLARELGEDMELFVGVGSDHDRESDRYTAIAVELVASLADLGDDVRARLSERAQAAIAKHCTVAHTVLSDDLDYRVEIVDESE